MSFSFNSMEAAEKGGGANVISEGPHRLTVEKMELKQTRAGTGEYYNCVICSLETGEKCFYMFNMVNPSAKAQEIGRAQFSSMYIACGLTQQIDQFTAEDVIGKTFMADVGIKRSEQFGEQNTLKNFRVVEKRVSAYEQEKLPDSDVPF